MNHARKAGLSLLMPGDIVPASGVYGVVHGNCESQELEMIFIAGQAFPMCRLCGSRVRFQLMRAVPHISEDRDFENMKG
jgi:hypothetical protein